MFELVRNNPELITINIIMLFVMWFTMRPAIHYADGVVSTKRLYLTLFMWFVFDLFAFWGSDWFHLYVAYQDIMKGDPIVEKVYSWIARRLAPNNYYLFRIIVWGTAQLLLWDSFKRLSISPHLVLALFVGIWLIWFSYGRVSLAMALVFWGITFYHQPHKIPVLPQIIGSIAILMSFFFHKSSIFLILVTFLAILTKRFNKIAFAICLIVFPILIRLISEEFVDAIMLTITDRFEDLDNYILKAQFYMDSEIESHGIGPMLGLFLEKIPYYLIAMLGLFAIYNDRSKSGYQNNAAVEDAENSIGYEKENDSVNENDDNEKGETVNLDEDIVYQDYCIPEDIKVFIRVLFYIVLLSSFLLFNINISSNTQVIYDRFIKFSMVPSAIVLAYLLDNYKYLRYAWWTYCLALFGTCYQMIYILYCSIANLK